MEIFNLEVAQMLNNHPILSEKDSYKCNYIRMLEYFVRKFSSDNMWANETLQLYKKTLLENLQDYRYEGFELRKQSKSVVAIKFKPFKFFSYRYCIIIDCIFINAINNKEKGELIFTELSSIYHKRYKNRIRHVFDALYNPDMSFDGYEQITYLANCWEKNRTFLSEEPVKIIVTATMSAGKSTLLNALIGKKINRTQNDACTAKIHCIKNKPYEDGYCYEYDYALELDANRQTLMDDNALNTGSEIIVGTYFRTINKTVRRIWLIDTPGVNSAQDRTHKEITEHYIKEAHSDMLLYVLNGENIGSEDDKNHLQFILEHYKGKVVFLINKLDRFQKDEDSISETLAAAFDDLRQIGFSNPVVLPLSSYAAYLAKMSIFGEELDKFSQMELGLIADKLNDTEYQFDTYYPDSLQSDVELDCPTEVYRLLLHSGILQLENMIYGMRGQIYERDAD